MKVRSALLSGVLLASALVVSLLLVEVVLRIYASTATTELARELKIDPYAVLVEPHGDVGYRPRPERTFQYPNGTVANTNAMGFRGPTVPVLKPAGTYRIVLLGGSTTFGWGVSDDETIDSHMRRILAERYPGRPIDVVNLAFDGYDSYQLYERLRSDGLKLDPDVVIVNTGVNDVRNARFPNLEDRDPRTLLWLSEMNRLRNERRRGGPSLWTRAKHYVYLARLPGAVRPRPAPRPDTALTPHPDALDYFEQNLWRLIELGTTSESVVMLFSTPPSSLRSRYEPDDPPIRSYWIRDAQTTQTYRDSLSARMRSVVAEAAAKGNVVAYVPHDEMEPALFLDDAHLTGAGNRRVAEDFVSALRPWLTQWGGRSP